MKETKGLKLLVTESHMKIQFSSANPVPAPAAIPKAVGRIPWGHMSHTWCDKQKSDKIALDCKQLNFKIKTLQQTGKKCP